ncbi:YfcC family protein, partial [Staphylococcus pasteuri]
MRVEQINKNKYSSSPKKKFKLKMPGAFAILFILTILAVLATWMIPAGSYSKLSYEDHSLKV